MNKNKKELITITHPFEPVYDSHSKILILGTMASPKSIEYGFFYGHPQNNFWRVLANIFDVGLPESIDDKKILLLKNNIAVWDVLHSCQISGADDSSIKNPVVNDFSEILAKSKIKAIFTAGMTATKIYNKYCFEKTGISAIYLPSTSPANRKYYNFDSLVKEYNIIKKYL
ncbi:MAG: DNA-deoxyinosine glycosylase [Oscillospiraceae bacterium]|nr:DNA-deoxyinosine glycosylase [Oscillospiraceae bacterium]